jgi:hypothetical protein
MVPESVEYAAWHCAPASIRDHLLKIGARVVASARRVVLHVPRSYPFLDPMGSLGQETWGPVLVGTQLEPITPGSPSCPRALGVPANTLGHGSARPLPRQAHPLVVFSLRGVSGILPRNAG